MVHITDMASPKSPSIRAFSSVEALMRRLRARLPGLVGNADQQWQCEGARTQSEERVCSAQVVSTGSQHPYTSTRTQCAPGSSNGARLGNWRTPFEMQLESQGTSLQSNQRVSTELEVTARKLSWHWKYT
jgi:hypothetical protein